MIIYMYVSILPENFVYENKNKKKSYEILKKKTNYITNYVT